MAYLGYPDDYSVNQDQSEKDDDRSDIIVTENISPLNNEKQDEDEILKNLLDNMEDETYKPNGRRGLGFGKEHSTKVESKLMTLKADDLEECIKISRERENLSTLKEPMKLWHGSEAIAKGAVPLEIIEVTKSVAKLIVHIREYKWFSTTSDINAIKKNNAVNMRAYHWNSIQVILNDLLSPEKVMSRANMVNMKNIQMPVEEFLKIEKLLTWTECCLPICNARNWNAMEATLPDKVMGIQIINPEHYQVQEKPQKTYPSFKGT
jgi:hypothetical protein